MNSMKSALCYLNLKYSIIVQSNHMNNTHLIVIVLLSLNLAATLNIPLPRSRQTCMVITPGTYEFEFVVSGINEKQVRCIVQDGQKVILQTTNRSEFETTFEVKENQASICFSSLDTQAKAVSFDFIRTDDPLRGLIADKEKMQIHEDLYSSYQELQKVYRGQHFFLQRNYIHEILLKNTQVALIFFLIVKLVVIVLAAFFQLFYVRQLFDNNYRPVPNQESSS